MDLFYQMQQLNNWLVLICGGGISALVLRLTSTISKLVKEKVEENRLREETIRVLKKQNVEQDERLKGVEDYQEMAEERSQKIIKAEKASLHNQIWNKADEYFNRGYITVGELNNFDYLFEGYKNLGGNGTGDTLHKKVSSLPQRDEGVLQQKEIDAH
ncbi:hypothetical protein IGI37_002249 [Enterococcus sp. AZ194]|uniref:hypothetical protein n=1 Tax=Enterococcus sp. AZ194 TaxID=2774629 RepID=UPI003F228295